MDFSFVILLCKRCLLGQTKRKGTLLTIFRPPRIFPAYYILHKFPTPLLIRSPPPPPRLFGFLEYIPLDVTICVTLHNKSISLTEPSELIMMTYVLCIFSTDLIPSLDYNPDNTPYKTSPQPLFCFQFYVTAVDSVLMRENMGQ